MPSYNDERRSTSSSSGKIPSSFQAPKGMPSSPYLSCPPLRAYKIALCSAFHRNQTSSEPCSWQKVTYRFLKNHMINIMTGVTTPAMIPATTPAATNLVDRNGDQSLNTVPAFLILQDRAPWRPTTQAAAADPRAADMVIRSSTMKEGPPETALSAARIMMRDTTKEASLAEILIRGVPMR